MWREVGWNDVPRTPRSVPHLVVPPLKLRLTRQLWFAVAVTTIIQVDRLCGEEDGQRASEPVQITRGSSDGTPEEHPVVLNRQDPVRPRPVDHDVLVMMTC